ncbi:UNVERIFIED_CONTAM: hypothetical protein HHA_226570 [Hammondia hammondi]|eukprot:XP_008882029.1 hypothetical protein HHA_226570 [Hammondia hammondi]
MSQPTSSTISPGTPLNCGNSERQLEVESSPMEGRVYTDNEIHSEGGHSVECPPPGSPIPQTTTFTSQAAPALQHRMMYPSTDALTIPAGHQQMMYFNPAAAGYTEGSHGFDPREGYPVVYPYVPMTLPIEIKKKRGFCC